MTAKRGASPHERTRRDHASEIAQDYAEAIASIADADGACRVTDLAEHFGVTHVTVIRTIQRLEREGLVSTEPYKPVELTPAGRRIADESRDRHDVVYRFLLAIGVDQATAERDAEGIEHHVSRATLERLRAIADKSES
ncbi:MAG: manganese-binding transcriptional regulator MntR [Planctomycetota bacterium]